jgi:hypothetical protein
MAKFECYEFGKSERSFIGSVFANWRWEDGENQDLAASCGTTIAKPGTWTLAKNLNYSGLKPRKTAPASSTRLQPAVV